MTLHAGHSIPVTSDKADLYRRQKLLYTEHRINGSGYQKSLSCAQCNSVTIPLFIKRMSQRISLKEAPKGILRINGRRFRCSYTRIACRFVQATEMAQRNGGTRFSYESSVSLAAFIAWIVASTIFNSFSSRALSMVSIRFLHSLPLFLDG